MKITVPAPAKINLYLDVTSKMENGFHEIKSIMQTVSLSDTVIIQTSESGTQQINVYCSDPEIPSGEGNIAYKAAKLFFEYFNVSDISADIYIEKVIPHAAGLAGGSTDAAAVIYGLNAALGNIGSDAKLLEIAAKVGSDVPFCLTKKTALALSRGEKITSLPDMPDCYILVCSAGEQVSSASAYAKLDEIYGDFTSVDKNGADIDQLISSINNGDILGVCKNTFNIFESAVLLGCPKAKRIRERLTELGAEAAMMSGSGSSVFGIFTDAKKATNARNELNSFCKAFICRPQ